MKTASLPIYELSCFLLSGYITFWKIFVGATLEAGYLLSCRSRLEVRAIAVVCFCASSPYILQLLRDGSTQTYMEQELTMFHWVQQSQHSICERVSFLEKEIIRVDSKDHHEIKIQIYKTKINITCSP